jgi:hypothetical protein
MLFFGYVFVDFFLYLFFIFVIFFYNFILRILFLITFWLALLIYRLIKKNMEIKEKNI